MHYAKVTRTWIFKSKIIQSNCTNFCYSGTNTITLHSYFGLNYNSNYNYNRKECHFNFYSKPPPMKWQVEPFIKLISLRYWYRRELEACLINQKNRFSSAFDDKSTLPLLSLSQARLGFNKNQPPVTPIINFDIQSPKLGGHVILGRNGSGKTLLSSVLSPQNPPHSNLFEGTIKAIDPSIARFPEHSVSYVSFESHERIIQSQGHATAWNIISGGGNLSRAAQFLVVRFGLFPLLHRPVQSLSTGEIRKVLLIRALSRRPRVLILDNALDGLDVPSRSVLRDLLSKAQRGFRQDLLVQAVDSRATAHTQIILLTHRVEEIGEETQFVTYVTKDHIVTEHRNGRTAESLLQKLGSIQNENLPKLEDVEAWWYRGRRDEKSRLESSLTQQPLVNLQNLQIRKGDTVLLRDLTWTIHPGQHWLVAGGNGAGKSTLSRYLALEYPNCSCGWVSTERHMAMSQSSQLVCQVLGLSEDTSLDDANYILRILGLEGNFLNRNFFQLSQGEQKLILIASAILAKPSLLVLDEPCQGLDFIHRHYVLRLVSMLCEATNITLIYITHHMEEMIPNVTHVLHLIQGNAVFVGKRQDYNDASNC
jgi:molybdate transport system ATP-binding protein